MRDKMRTKNINTRSERRVDDSLHFSILSLSLSPSFYEALLQAKRIPGRSEESAQRCKMKNDNRGGGAGRKNQA